MAHENSSRTISLVMSEELESLYKFAVEYSTESGRARARFTKEKHARNFYRAQKKLGIKDLRFFLIDAGQLIALKVK